MPGQQHSFAAHRAVAAPQSGQIVVESTTLIFSRLLSLFLNKIMCLAFRAGCE